MKYGGKCPVCGRKMTVGVSHRVEELADREEGYIREDAKTFERLVPLPEVIGASVGSSPSSKKVQKEYEKMLTELGPEFEILRNLPLEDIRRVSGGRIAEGIRRLRKGDVERIPGFDGEYGVIRLFCADELNNMEGQMDFFKLLGAADSSKDKNSDQKKQGSVQMQSTGDDVQSTGHAQIAEEADNSEEKTERVPLNTEQRHAVVSASPAIAVKAGPICDRRPGSVNLWIPGSGPVLF